MRLQDSFRQYVRDDRGTVLVEFLILLPLLVWTMLALVVYWDVFRTMNTAQKAAYSISDLISRQENNLNLAFVNGMQDVFDYLMLNNGQDSRIRITSVVYDKPNDKYISLFSVSPDNKVAPYSEAEIQTLKDRIPLMSNLDSVVIVETAVDYVPAFDLGVLNVTATLGSQVFTEFVVTRPRFKSRICLETPGCPVGL